MALIEHIRAFERGELSPEACIERIAEEENGSLTRLIRGMPMDPDKSFILQAVAVRYDKDGSEFPASRAVLSLVGAYRRGELTANDLVHEVKGELLESVLDYFTGRQKAALSAAMHRYQLAQRIQDAFDADTFVQPTTTEETFAFCAALERMFETDIGLTGLALILTEHTPLTLGSGAVSAYERSKAAVLEALYDEARDRAHFLQLVAERWEQLSTDPTLIATYAHRAKLPFKPYGYSYCRNIYNAIKARR